MKRSSGSGRGRRGFTLIEVVVALLVMEVALLGALGTLVVATRSLHRAERLERATGRTEAVLDSLGGGATVGMGTGSFRDVRVEWQVDSAGVVGIRATDLFGEVLIDLSTRVPIG